MLISGLVKLASCQMPLRTGASWEITMDVEQPDPMESPVACDSCGWIGKYGEVIARDKLRCPKCDDTVHVVKHDPHGTVQ
jgi:RNase P subunit RPR2